MLRTRRNDKEDSKKFAVQRRKYKYFPRRIIAVIQWFQTCDSVPLGVSENSMVIAENTKKKGGLE
jgi:hypothetical protein